MTRYTKTLLSLVACVSMLAAGACDSDDKEASDDAGADTAQAAKEAQNGGSAAAQKPGPDAGAESKRRTAEASQSGQITEKPPLEIEELLTVEDLEKKYQSMSFETGPLVGLAPSPRYNARRIYPSGGEDYGAGLQVWSFDKASSATQRLKSFKEQYLNVSSLPEDASDFGKDAFVAERSGIRNLLFQTDEPVRVVAVSCSNEICKSTANLVALAEIVKDRVGGQAEAKQKEAGKKTEEESPKE